ncbi:hypothetical protein ACEPPN_012877 [Leptodophora sp. 'Broadleaf-Isolate-01']
MPHSCQPSFVLEGASEVTFNKKSAPFSVKLTCSSLDITTFSAFANFEPVTNLVATAEGITFQGFTDEYVLLYIYALDITGTPFLGSFQLLFGAINMPVLILDPAGAPAKDVGVQANSTIYIGVSQLCTTGDDGKCTFTNLIASTISLVARTGDNAIAVNGLAATTGLVTISVRSSAVWVLLAPYSGGLIRTSYRISETTRIGRGKDNIVCTSAKTNAILRRIIQL